MANLGNIRREYTLHELDEKSVQKDPFQQFSVWMDEALKAQEPEPTAMALSTVSADLKPSSRIVLLKNFSEQGFDFFTNYNSKKGLHIDQNPNISVLFFWPTLEREVRIEGKAIKVGEVESDEYFNSRPRQSQISAWASPQSSPIPDRKTLENRYAEIENTHINKNIKRPLHWGGYRLLPELFEFWQGRESRFHDRIEYILLKDKWIIRRIAP